MSDTKNKSNTAVACGELKTDEKKIISIEHGAYGPSKNEINQLAGKEIKFDEESTVTNETPDGRTAMIDKKTGNVIGYLDGDGTLNRKLAEMDRKEQRILAEDDKEH